MFLAEKLVGYCRGHVIEAAGVVKKCKIQISQKSLVVLGRASNFKMLPRYKNLAVLPTNIAWQWRTMDN